MDHSWSDLKSKLDNNVNLSVEDNMMALECMEHLPALDRQDRKKTILVLCDLRFPFFFDMIKNNFTDIKKELTGDPDFVAFLCSKFTELQQMTFGIEEKQLILCSLYLELHKRCKLVAMDADFVQFAAQILERFESEYKIIEEEYRKSLEHTHEWINYSGGAPIKGPLTNEGHRASVSAIIPDKKQRPASASLKSDAPLLSQTAVMDELADLIDNRWEELYKSAHIDCPDHSHYMNVNGTDHEIAMILFKFKIGSVIQPSQPVTDLKCPILTLHDLPSHLIELRRKIAKKTIAPHRHYMQSSSKAWIPRLYITKNARFTRISVGDVILPKNMISSPRIATEPIELRSKKRSNGSDSNSLSSSTGWSFNSPKRSVKVSKISVPEVNEISAESNVTWLVAIVARVQDLMSGYYSRTITQLTTLEQDLQQHYHEEPLYSELTKVRFSANRVCGGVNCQRLIDYVFVTLKESYNSSKGKIINGLRYMEDRGVKSLHETIASEYSKTALAWSAHIRVLLTKYLKTLVNVAAYSVQQKKSAENFSEVISIIQRSLEELILPQEKFEHVWLNQLIDRELAEVDLEAENILIEKASNEEKVEIKAKIFLDCVDRFLSSFETFIEAHLRNVIYQQLPKVSSAKLDRL